MSTDSPSGRTLAVKCRKCGPTEAAQILLKLIVDGKAVLALEILNLLDNMPFDYFDTLLEQDTRLSELYYETRED